MEGEIAQPREPRLSNDLAARGRIVATADEVSQSHTCRVSVKTIDDLCTLLEEMRMSDWSGATPSTSVVNRAKSGVNATWLIVQRLVAHIREA